MEKAQLRKNRLDLEYHGETQKANALLILLTTGILGFLGTFVWLNNTLYFLYGIGATLILFSVGFVFYHKKLKRMRQILDEIEKLE